MSTRRFFDEHPEVMDSFPVAELLGHTPSQIRLMAQRDPPASAAIAAVAGPPAWRNGRGDF